MNRALRFASEAASASSRLSNVPTSTDPPLCPARTPRASRAEPRFSHCCGYCAAPRRDSGCTPSSSSAQRAPGSRTLCYGMYGRDIARRAAHKVLQFGDGRTNRCWRISNLVLDSNTALVEHTSLIGAHAISADCLSFCGVHNHPVELGVQPIHHRREMPKQTHRRSSVTVAKK